jgi:hypothetical protein
VVRVLVIISWVAVLAAQVPGAARAATVFSYSAADNTYGWCVKGDYGTASGCAAAECRGYGGAACQEVLSCSGGYSAVAFAEEPVRGVGLTCGLSSPFWAQIMALAQCAVAANTLCWTNVVFDDAARTTGAEANDQTDRTIYAQSMLQLRGKGITVTTGVADAETSAAILGFQREVGLAETGTTEVPLLFHLIAATGGRQPLVDAMDKGLVKAHAAVMARNVFAYAANPFPRRALTQELAAMTEVDRGDAMATYLRSRGTDCAAPVTVELPPEGFAELVSVDCAGRGHTVIITDAMSVINSDGE